MSIWRRRRNRMLVRLWGEDYQYVGALRGPERVEPWAQYTRRLVRTAASSWRRVLRRMLFRSRPRSPGW